MVEFIYLCCIIVNEEQKYKVEKLLSRSRQKAKDPLQKLLSRPEKR